MADAGMRFLIETWLALGSIGSHGAHDFLLHSAHESAACGLQQRAKHPQYCAGLLNGVDTSAMPTSYFNTTSMQTSRVSWQALVYVWPCHWWQLHKYHDRCQSELQAVCFPPSSTRIRSLNWRSLHQSLVACTTLPISPQSLNGLRKLAFALSKVSRGTWQK